ncbi:hypothetical protein BT93_L4036 [Corymbia citriodora subsp. variegata]|uniref:Uncharacterized protein n=1 Tax=Corymbia citriodora subsp. variegata TaxID=360336 RepID=A0A8T0CKP9_CORYI|nr:hypothetical protein BT93_L4036 [Corymbia citriodora subsp. variegata]
MFFGSTLNTHFRSAFSFATGKCFVSLDSRSSGRCPARSSPRLTASASISGAPSRPLLHLRSRRAGTRRSAAISCRGWSGKPASRSRRAFRSGNPPTEGRFSVLHFLFRLFNVFELSVMSSYESIREVIPLACLLP